MGFYLVYILKCWNDNRLRNTDFYLYTGYAKDLDIRIKQHRSGQTKSIKRFKYMKYAYYEKVRDRVEARKRELFVKKQSREWKLELIQSNKNL